MFEELKSVPNRKDIPTVSNLTAAQSVDPTSDFTLVWNIFLRLLSPRVHSLLLLLAHFRGPCLENRLVSLVQHA